MRVPGFRQLFPLPISVNNPITTITATTSTATTTPPSIPADVRRSGRSGASGSVRSTAATSLPTRKEWASAWSRLLYIAVFSLPIRHAPRLAKSSQPGGHQAVEAGHREDQGYDRDR